ncbi:NADPH:protochlorophyllide oxidoreductase [Fragilariopsis cylindrus CCMP1102]|uniref:protochlorophyllide reductase n=1 Tax=Fragilariopsis cylindrus CCMP1102 TaxID=635003 RepID=A0A1E7FRC0_9STRA|nr:NADPH:protochlorophyllide oxidoreductase [Fragilariopsis cylindrus CCMP1102]|eukprot:OEU20696.1 NADPH:protochlorophyllide oxidoreductase [Fragilariopsis cylindrus CCMP1102]
MAIRILLAATCLMAPLVTGFGPAATVQRNTMTNTIASPRDASISNVRLSLISGMDTESADIDIVRTNGKLYNSDSKEVPKVLGGVKIGLKKLVVITGASSGLGLSTTTSLAKTGKYHVIMACRNIEKAKRVAKEVGLPENSFTVMKLELASTQSIRDFVANLKAFKSARPLTHLICNAAVYRPTDPEPAWTDDGFEMSMGVNHLGHFLLVNLLMDDMSRAKGARVCIVGSITGNTNTVGGGLVYPQANLGNLEGFEQGGLEPVSMIDGKPFFGAKAYKDSKVCNMMTVSELSRRYAEDTGIVFSSMYPGCIAETALFREKRQWFRKIFPAFMKYVTGGYVSEAEAGDRLAQVIDDPQCDKSGVYWSWNGGAQSVGRWSEDGKPRGAGGSGGEIFENEQSDAVTDAIKSKKMWDLSKKVVKLTDKEMYKGGKLED